MSFIEKRRNFFDQIKPQYEALENALNEALLESSYREELKKYLGEEPFALAALHKEAFSPEIMEDLMKENELSSHYSELLANLTATMEEGEVPLSQIGAHMGSED